MKFIKKEHHQVISTKTYEIPDEVVIEAFGSLERFEEVLSHLSNDQFSEPYGEYPSDEESDLFYDFYEEYDYEQEDDWWTDRKGGYEVTFEMDLGINL